ncbi:hypothetical protein ANO11243_089750 [Dothideomycetidae sp. 11243]|nr:hypothetical protein ANO11243_089750 [fungal sp. No.11243]
MALTYQDIRVKARKQHNRAPARRDGPPSILWVAIPAALITAKILGLTGLMLVLHSKEKKERQKLAAAIAGTPRNSPAMVEKTVIIENKGPQGGTAGVAEVVTTGPAGTQVTTMPTIVGGAAIVSTTAAGIPGGSVTVEPGKLAVVKAEHPPGRPEEAKIVSTTHHA